MTSTSATLTQFAPAAASLFNNMKTPAAIIAGAMIPLGFAAPIPQTRDPKDTTFDFFLRRISPFMAVAALGSELLSVMWATVAVNQLTESKVKLAESVWHLLKRDFELEWAATNAHFSIGMFLFMCVIGTRSYFIGGQGALGKSACGLAMSILLLMVSIVNRGVASGGGDGMRYGGNVLSLFRVYISHFLKRAFSTAGFGPLEIGAVGLLLVSTVGTINSIWSEISCGDLSRVEPSQGNTS